MNVLQSVLRAVHSERKDLPQPSHPVKTTWAVIPMWSDVIILELGCPYVTL